MRRMYVPYCAIFLMSLVGSLCADDITFAAEDYDGKDDVWRARHEAGTRSWGIVGNRVVTSGTMWFDSFPGVTGEYHVYFGVVLEGDGRPSYRVSAGGTVLASGKYPWPEGDGCSSIRSKADTLDIGEHTITNGDRIEVWGESTYECDPGHGAYTRWYEVRFVPVLTDPTIALDKQEVTFSVEQNAPHPSDEVINVSNAGQGTLPSLSVTENCEWLAVSVSGSGNTQEIHNSVISTSLEPGRYDANVRVEGEGVSEATYTVTLTIRDQNTGETTELLSPEPGTALTEGTEIELIGVGDNLTWSYDADSDGEGEVEIGTGDTVTFSVPTGVTGAREITIYLRGDNGNAGETYSIVRDTLIRVISPNGGEGYNSGDTVEIQWETNTSVISDVDIFYSVNAGNTWEKINAESSVSISDSEWGEYPWVIPPGTESQECLIRVEKYEAVQASHRDMSDGVFSIGASDVVRAGISPQSYSGFLIAYSDGRVAITSGKNVFSQIELHDMRGRSSIRITNPESRRECSIPVRRHTMYLVRITAGGKTTTFPLVTIR